jgi:asparagine synthase (glutamine-hydrolysing)
MDTWLWHQEEPVGGSGAYAQYCVARLAREQGIKVLLDGQGADEQLAGYRKFILVYLRQLLHTGHYFHAAREATAFLSSWDILKTSQLAGGRRYMGNRTRETASLWTGIPCPARPMALKLGTSLGQRLHADITTFSLPLLLRFEDRNTMAFGVESRVPYVDHVLVEWIAKVPADLRLSQGWTKRIIRDSLADLLPPMVRSRKTKLGFSTPESKWLRGPLKSWLMQMLGEPEYLSAVVERAGVTELLERYARSGSSRVAEQQLFRLAVYENWARLFLSKQQRTCPKPAASLNGDSAMTYAINQMSVESSVMWHE